MQESQEKPITQPTLPTNTNTNMNTTTTIPTNTSTNNTNEEEETQLLSQLRLQVEFYFSPQNLSRDAYLRNLLDSHGGSVVPLIYIANFRKVQSLYSQIGRFGSRQQQGIVGCLMEALGGSSVVSVSLDGAWISPLLPVPPLILGPPPLVVQQQQQLPQQLPQQHQAVMEQQGGSISPSSQSESNTSSGGSNKVDAVSTDTTDNVVNGRSSSPTKQQQQQHQQQMNAAQNLPPPHYPPPQQVQQHPTVLPHNPTHYPVLVVDAKTYAYRPPPPAGPQTTAGTNTTGVTYQMHPPPPQYHPIHPPQPMHVPPHVYHQTYAPYVTTAPPPRGMYYANANNGAIYPPNYGENNPSRNLAGRGNNRGMDKTKKSRYKKNQQQYYQEGQNGVPRQQHRRSFGEPNSEENGGGYGRNDGGQRTDGQNQRDNMNSYDNTGRGGGSFKSRKKKSKRRDGEHDRKESEKKEVVEMMNDNMFPALSPSKKVPSSNNDGNVGEKGYDGGEGVGSGGVYNKNFSGYADALLQRAKEKKTTSPPPPQQQPSSTTTDDKEGGHEGHTKVSSHTPPRPAEKTHDSIVEKVMEELTIDDRSNDHPDDNNDDVKNQAGSAAASTGTVATVASISSDVSNGNRVKSLEVQSEVVSSMGSGVRDIEGDGDGRSDGNLIRHDDTKLATVEGTSTTDDKKRDEGTSGDSEEKEMKASAIPTQADVHSPSARDDTKVLLKESDEGVGGEVVPKPTWGTRRSFLDVVKRP